jgi:hypothetical protein
MVAIVSMSVGSIGLVSNLTERDGTFYSACSQPKKILSYERECECGVLVRLAWH